jgi:CDP-glucose 4,6-dehydratase
MQNGKFGNMNLFGGIYKGKTVLLTGDTGFKGSWMANWLLKLGANVIGYSLKPNTNPSHFELLKLDYNTHFNDICDLESLNKVVKTYNPDIIFHLAAQPLVRYSYSNPIETYQTNILGTANVLESARQNNKVKAIVIVTTDKCYENLEQEKGYLEKDKMGGYDPYSSSKGCAELVVASYRNSFFNLNDYNNKHITLIASARAGNVIGGGDWSLDRLIPDIVKASSNKEEVIIRNPNATRPWQHVLEPISGYLKLGSKLLNGEKDFAEGWNFGPEEHQMLSVKQVLDKAKNNWESINYTIEFNQNQLHEANLLSLNIDKAKNKLGWKPVWGNDLAIERTIDWYKNFYLTGTLNTDSDLNFYTKSLNE